MIGALARKFFGSANDRRIKGYQSRVDAINALEPEIAALSDEALKARTAEFRQQLAGGRTLDDILVPAFATVREAAKRTLGQRHFDVQMIGGMVLHEGDIAEMKTGEQHHGKAARHGGGGEAEAKAGFRFRERRGHGKSLSLKDGAVWSGGTLAQSCDLGNAKSLSK